MYCAENPDEDISFDKYKEDYQKKKEEIAKFDKEYKKQEKIAKKEQKEIAKKEALEKLELEQEQKKQEKIAKKEQEERAKKEALEKLALEQEQKKQEEIAKKEQRERANKEYLEKLELEKEQKKQQKDTQKARQEDINTMAQLGQKKLSLTELFSETREPRTYVIAPMTYDTKQFVQDNSHDKALFGTKDNSAERLTVLESCITDFIRAVDDKTGVSFLDRSKISQIEKEHKFQLGDWSSASKTAEMGHALNANVLLFLDKFGFVDQGSGEYRFEAKFVDINTMQSSVYNISYQNAKKKITTPGVVQTISFRDFTAIPAESAPFSDELSLTVKNALRTVQRSDMAEICPLGAVQKFALSEYDTLQPKTELLKLSSIIFDGFGGAELRWCDKAESATYSFTQSVPRTERVGYSFYTDGRIGTLTLKTSAGEETLDVYTADNREFYLLLGNGFITNYNFFKDDVRLYYYLHMTRN